MPRLPARASAPEGFAGIFATRQAYGEPGYRQEWRERVALPVFSGRGRLTESRVTGMSERERVALPVFSGRGRLTESRVTGKSERARKYGLTERVGGF